MHVCDQDFEEFAPARNDAYELKSDMLLKNLENFTRYEWLRKQSFCLENQPMVKLVQRITEKGLCFTSSGDNQMLNDDV